jgi:hypothetical protein
MGILKSGEDMINTNPLDFMLKFLEGMKKGMSATEAKHWIALVYRLMVLT